MNSTPFSFIHTFRSPPFFFLVRFFEINYKGSPQALEPMTDWTATTARMLIETLLNRSHKIQKHIWAFWFEKLPLSTIFRKTVLKSKILYSWHHKNSIFFAVSWRKNSSFCNVQLQFCNTQTCIEIPVWKVKSNVWSVLFGFDSSEIVLSLLANFFIDVCLSSNDFTDKTRNQINTWANAKKFQQETIPQNLETEKRRNSQILIGK